MQVLIPAWPLIVFNGLFAMAEIALVDGPQGTAAKIHG